MSYVMGEQVQLGLGVEDTRGTAVEPQAWIPARTPTGIVSVVEKVQIRETRGSGISSQGAEVVQLRAEGDLEFNVRNTTIGYIIKSLLGTVQSNTASGATTHTFTRQVSGPQNPALTLALAQPGAQNYEYALAIVSSLEIRTPVDDLVNATASFMAAGEAEHAAYTPAFDEETDVIFRNHDVTIKFADTVDDLAAANAVCINEFNISFANSARAKQCIGNINPTDIFSLITEISGSFVADFEDVEDYYDVFKDGGYKAMQITMERDDLDELGTGSGLYPMVQITLPRVSFDGYTPDRPIDDIVTESIDFMGHYDEEEGAAVTFTVQNEQADYDAEPGS